MRIFESGIVKSVCPMQENYEIYKDFIQTCGLLLLVLLFVLKLKKEALKMKIEALKKSSENDQSSGHFQSFFFFSFSSPRPLI